MNKKQKWVLFLSITLPLFILTGYQMVDNYSTSTSQLPLYQPSDNTLNDSIQPTKYDIPSSFPQNEQKTEIEWNSNPRPAGPAFPSSAPSRPPHHEKRSHTIQEKPQQVQVHIENKKIALNTNTRVSLKSNTHKDLTWKNFNYFRTETLFSWTHTKVVRKKRTKKKQRPTTPYSMMNEITPDIDSGLGYTK